MKDPTDEHNHYWLQERRYFVKAVESTDIGKWLLFYSKSEITKQWYKAIMLYRNGELPGVHSMKCSTAKLVTPREIIVMYCNYSYDEETIMGIGKVIKDAMGINCTIYYKTDKQTYECAPDINGTPAHQYSI